MRVWKQLTSESDGAELLTASSDITVQLALKTLLFAHHVDVINDHYQIAFFSFVLEKNWPKFVCLLSIIKHAEK